MAFLALIPPPNPSPPPRKNIVETFANLPKQHFFFLGGEGEGGIVGYLFKWWSRTLKTGKVSTLIVRECSSRVQTQC